MNGLLQSRCLQVLSRLHHMIPMHGHALNFIKDIGRRIMELVNI